MAQLDSSFEFIWAGVLAAVVKVCVMVSSRVAVAYMLPRLLTIPLSGQWDFQCSQPR